GITRDLAGVLDETERTAYRTVAANFPSPDVIARMIDPELPLRLVKTKLGDRIVSEASIKELEAKGVLISVEPVREAPAGLRHGHNIFDPDQAVQLKLCRATYNSRAELAAALQLPRQSLTEDWLAGRTKVAWVVE